MAAALVCAAATQVKFWAVGLLGVVACFASRIVRWVRFPHGPPVFRQSRMRGRYAPLKTERAAFNSLGWHQSGNGVMAWHPCLGSTWSEFNSQFPDQFMRPCQRGMMAFATNEVYAGSNPAGRSKIVLQ